MCILMLELCITLWLPILVDVKILQHLQQIHQ